MEIIRLENICKTYGTGEGRVEALKGISLSIKEGELVAIVGASGSGKSTLLNILGVIDRATKGEYYFKGDKVDLYSDKKLAILRNEELGFILQYFGLVPSYTVYENVELPLIYAKSKKRKDKIEKMLTKLEIVDKKEKLPSELSGGQNQRVAIARALINNPSIILADEPTGALDKDTSNQVMAMLKSLNKEGKTVIIITHDENISKECDRVINFEDGQVKGDSLNEKEN